MYYNFHKHVQSVHSFSILFHTSSCSGIAPRQTGNFMRKILGNTKKKNSTFNVTVSTATDTLPKRPVENISSNPRRVVILNKLFMRNITDLMSTEVFSSQLLGLGVEVNRVKITRDYKILKVFWTTTCFQQEDAEKILTKNAGLLRHELSQLRLMGNVPVIQFVKDKHYAELIQLNNKLAIADYGEERPSKLDPVANLISELELCMPIDVTVKDELVKLENEEAYDAKQPELMSIAQCIFYLDYSDMINRIRKSPKKSKNCDSNGKMATKNWASFKCNQYSNIEYNEFGDLKTQRESFNKFLQQRKIMKMKYKESQHKHITYTEEQVDNTRHFEIHDIDKDFILEDVDE